MGALTRTWLARPGRTTRRAMTARWWTSSRSAQMLKRLFKWNLEAIPLAADPSVGLCLNMLMYGAAGLLKHEQGQALGMLSAYSAVLNASILPPTEPTRVHVFSSACLSVHLCT